MSQTIKIQRGYSLNGEQLGGPGNKEESIAVGQLVTVSEAIADATTDGLVALTLDVSQLKAIYLESDEDVTLETNSGAAPANTISLAANIPQIWTESDGAALRPL